MKQYRVKRVESKLMSFEGEYINSQWEQANILSDFTFPWEDQSAPKMDFRALHDTDFLYFRFDVENTNNISYIKDNHKMEVVNSDRVEIFFRQDEDLDPYYCLEMDARGRILDYSTRYYRDFNYDWKWPNSGCLSVNTFENHLGYVVEGNVSLSSLKNLGLLKDKSLQVGLYRGYCTKLIESKAEFKWISWLKPKSEKPDFHIPSSFGLLKLE